MSRVSVFVFLCIVAMGKAAFCPGTALTDSDRAALVDRHNQLRSQLAKGQAVGKTGTLPAGKNIFKMQWDCGLESSAQSWTNGCQFAHSGGAYGENLWMGSGQTGTNGQLLASASDSWWSELTSIGITSADVNNFTMTTFNKGVGHFTQMAWGNTDKVGCGIKVCGSSKIITCQYLAQGNYLNSKIYEIGSACSADSQCTTKAGSKCSTSEGLCTAPGYVAVGGSGGGATAPPPTTTTSAPYYYYYYYK